MTTLRWSCVLALGCHGDVIGLPLYPTYKCSFHSVNETAWEQPSPFTTVWLHLYEVCCWLEAGAREGASVSILGLCTWALAWAWSIDLCSAVAVTQAEEFFFFVVRYVAYRRDLFSCYCFTLFVNIAHLQKDLFPIYFIAIFLTASFLYSKNHCLIGIFMKSCWQQSELSFMTGTLWETVC